MTDGQNMHYKYITSKFKQNYTSFKTVAVLISTPFVFISHIRMIILYIFLTVHLQIDNYTLIVIL